MGDAGAGDAGGDGAAEVFGCPFEAGLEIVGAALAKLGLLGQRVVVVLELLKATLQLLCVKVVVVVVAMTVMSMMAV